MKSLTILNLSISLLLALLFCNGTARAQQQYKLRQVTSMTSMKSETTIYVKGMRKRTESNGYMGIAAITTIEQCDKQRTISINDKKKLYFIEPFSRKPEEIIDEDVKTAKAKAESLSDDSKGGGIITNYYTIVDTGERKKIFGFTARRIWTTQKLVPSANACMMKDSMIIKTDGWYIDFPDFNCQNSFNTSSYGGYQKAICQDRFVTRKKGKGKLGFALTEKRTMIMGGQTHTSEFVTDLETLELSTGKLDSMLFEIPPGYKEAKNIDDLQEQYNSASIVSSISEEKSTSSSALPQISSSSPKKEGAIRIGVLLPTGEEQLTYDELRNYICNNLNTGNIEAVSINNSSEATTAQCDYILHTAFTQVKQASKIGGLLKAIKNTNPSASVSYTIGINMLLKKTSNNNTHSQLQTSDKYEGKPDDAASKAISKTCNDLLKEL